MAKINSSISSILISSFLLMMLLTPMVAGQPTPSPRVPLCKVIHGVQQGETCASLTQDFSIDMPHFLQINPNINCNTIFVGQWVCVNGKLV
ncbi:hypothetical protein HN51_049009 [Arachis hypogaea]|uniref:LysM domain-containing protein n=1 Tax=Arachis hypogaea TaxID=3818 RepID=A0A445E7U2_ARAHY|nr:Putative L,D-transpeptidase YkuD [Arachis hypogaea]RYR71586.1 hypothetical protein Ahy_A02g005824 [Arachis hypogaea]